MTFFSAARTIPLRGGPGYFLSRSSFASSSFFLAAAERTTGAGVGVSPSTAIASTVVGSEVKGVAEGPGARIPTTVPAWPASRREPAFDRRVDSHGNSLMLSKAYST